MKCLLFVTFLLALILQPNEGFTLSSSNHHHLRPARSIIDFRRIDTRTKVVSEPDLVPLEDHYDDRKSPPSPKEIPGKHKWLGGAVDQEGRIYGVPSNAKEVICLAPPVRTIPSESSNPEDDVDAQTQYEMHTIPLPKSVAEGQFKWLRGIVWENYLIGIPAWSKAGVLWVDFASYWEDKKRQMIEIEAEGDVAVDDDQSEGNENKRSISTDERFVNVLPLPEEALENMEGDDSSAEGMVPERWLWHGAAMNQNRTAIYAIPSNAQQVLKIDLLTKTTSLLPIPATVTPLSQTNKWYGGILGDDNAIYGVPYAASGVLRIDANTDEVQLIGEEKFGVMEYNWHGGIKSQDNGQIYCFPAHNSHVLAIDTRTISSSSGSDTASLEERLSLLEIHRAPYDNDEVTRYKWLGGSLGADGNIYGMPSDASSILRIDTETNIATTFGKVSGEKNKYQGGTLGGDGFIYAIPSDANNILCIDSNKSSQSTIEDKVDGTISFLHKDTAFTIGDIKCTKKKKKDKWQGGFLGRDKAIYCIPENFNTIMKLTPRQRESIMKFL